MAGHLNRHPYLKTFDELQRSEKRMRMHLEMNRNIIPIDEQSAIEILLDALQKALRQIPEHYHLTKHFQNHKE